MYIYMYIYGVHGCRRRTASRSRPSRLYNLIDPLDPAPTIPQGLEEFDPIPQKILKTRPGQPRRVCLVWVLVWFWDWFWFWL